MFSRFVKSLIFVGVGAYEGLKIFNVRQLGLDDNPPRYTHCRGQFYFYDNRHSTGIDAKIPDMSYGVILISDICTLRDFSQAAYRMRRLDIPTGHRIVAYIDEKYIPESSISSSDSMLKISKNAFLSCSLVIL